MPENLPNPFGRIMACVTLSPHLEKLVGEVAALAAVCDAQMTFLHVGDDARPVQERIDKALAGLGGARVTAQAGKPHRVILREAQRQAAGLIYLGAMQEDPVFRGVIGSVARRVARTADRSVLLSIHRELPRGLPGSIVAGVNFDEPSRRMLADVLAIVRRAGTRTLHIVHEYDPYSMGVSESTGSGGASEEPYERMNAAAKRLQMANFLEQFDLADLDVQTACLQGRNSAETIVYAERHGADLLAVAGPPKRIGLFDRFFGHPTVTLLQRLPCSLLLHRAAPGDAAPTGKD